MTFFGFFVASVVGVEFILFVDAHRIIVFFGFVKLAVRKGFGAKPCLRCGLCEAKSAILLVGLVHGETRMNDGIATHLNNSLE